MGACSSKPKTTEFEGSLEPRKPTDVAAGQPQETERSLENLADDHAKEASGKAEGKGEGADASTEGAQTTHKLDLGKDDGPLKEVFLSSTEGTSTAQSDVLGEKEAVNKEANDEVEQKESKGGGVDDEVVQKDDVGSAAADIASVNKKGAQDKVDESVIDEAKTCEDKAVVSEETGSSQADASYVDKAVALDAVKAPEGSETLEKRIIIVPEEEASSVLDSNESAGIESPIIGVVQPVEPMKEEDASKPVVTESEKDGENVTTVEDPQEESTVADESLTREARDADGCVSATEDVHKDVSELAGEASSEVNSAPLVETLPPVSAIETLAPVEADPLKDGDEGISQPQGETPSDAVVNVLPATTDSQIDVEGYPKDTKSGVPLDESVVTHKEDSHADTVGDEALNMETPRTSKNPDVFNIEPKTEEAHEESIIVEDVDASIGHVLATEKAFEDGSSKDESAPEREENAEHVPTGEPGKEAIPKPLMERAPSGDAPFEDALDAPLKLEASNSIGPGQVPS